MQSQVPIKNYVYFFLVSSLLILVYPRVRDHFFPPAPVPERLWALDRIPREEQLEAISRLIPTTGSRGIADAVDFGFQYARRPLTPERPKPQWAYDSETRSEQDAAVARMVLAASGGPLDAAQIAQAYRINRRVLARQAEFGQPVEEIVMGGNGFPITATMTPRGGGVSELWLNEFPAADWYGLPMKDANGKVKPLELIPRNLDWPPAFAVFHYPTPDDKEPQPLETLGRVTWSVAKKDVLGDKHEVAFATELTNPGVRITKTFTVAKGEYHVGLTVRVEKLSGSTAEKFRYQLVGARELPIEGGWFATTFRLTHIGLVDDRDILHRLSSDSATLAHSGGGDRIRKDNKRIVYAATALQYFASCIAVDNLGPDGTALPTPRKSFLQFARATLEQSNEKKPFLGDITVRVVPEALELAEPTEHRYLLYHGPVKVQQLSRLSGPLAVNPALVDRYLNALQLRTLTDYGTFGWWTDAIIFFTNIIHKLLGLLDSFLPGGIAIICVTILVRAMIFPLSKRQAQKMQIMQEKQQKAAPEMKEIEAKYKDDFLAKQQAQRELYRKHNINPAAGLTGCLMLFIQMPVFMGLYYSLQENVFFRLERFLWMPNLTAPDMLFKWGEKIPWISDPESQGSLLYLGPFLNLLPIIGAILIFVQQKKAMPAEMTDEQRQQYQIMKYMTIFMALMFYKVPAGLSLYFIVSSVWGLTERYIVKKKLDAAAAERAAVKPGSGSKPKAKLPPKPPGKLGLWWQQLLRDASKK